jgi:hypothetical protein
MLKKKKFYSLEIMRLDTALCPFLTRDHALGIIVPLPYHYRTQGTPLPQRDSPFLQKKGRGIKSSHSHNIYTL